MGVSEGIDVGVSEGTGVSVKELVGIAEAVCVTVEVGGVNDSAGGFDVLPGGWVPAGVEDDCKLQANRVNINRVEKTSFRFIGEVHIPFQVNWNVLI